MTVAVVTAGDAYDAPAVVEWRNRRGLAHCQVFQRGARRAFKPEQQIPERRHDPAFEAHASAAGQRQAQRLIGHHRAQQQPAGADGRPRLRSLDDIAGDVEENVRRSVSADIDRDLAAGAGCGLELRRKPP